MPLASMFTLQRRRHQVAFKLPGNGSEQDGAIFPNRG